jgi:hypothetical protein
MRALFKTAKPPRGRHDGFALSPIRAVSRHHAGSRTDSPWSPALRRDQSARVCKHSGTTRPHCLMSDNSTLLAHSRYETGSDRPAARMSSFKLWFWALCGFSLTRAAVTCGLDCGADRGPVVHNCIKAALPKSSDHSHARAAITSIGRGFCRAPHAHSRRRVWRRARRSHRWSQ